MQFLVLSLECLFWHLSIYHFGTEVHYQSTSRSISANPWFNQWTICTNFVQVFLDFGIEHIDP